MLKPFFINIVLLTLNVNASRSKTSNYDYIVVGSGPGGGTVAVELAKKGYSTLLIEAGPIVKNDNITIPGFHPMSTEDPKISWDFYVKHYSSSVGYRQNVLYPRASALGGCANHHTMISMYPNSADFKMMVNISKDNSWSERNMRKIFKYIENNNYINFQGDSHGFNGFFDTRMTNLLKMPSVTPQQIEYFLKVVGNPLKDLNGYSSDQKTLNTDLEGNVFIPSNINKNYERSSFSDYILQSKDKYPLTIWPNTLATKILFDTEAIPKAIGIAYADGEYLYQASPLNQNEDLRSGIVMARKEVIVSAGAFNTPQILMLSGIGKKEHLNKLGIDTIVDLPGVGQNLKDRYEIPIITKFKTSFLPSTCNFESNSDDHCYKEYLEKLGPYTSNGVVSGRLEKSSADLKVPDFVTINTFGGFFGYRKGWSNRALRPLDRVTSLIIKAKPRGSKGTIRLKSTNPFETPLINFNYFYSDTNDLNLIAKQIIKQRERINGFTNETIEIKPGKKIQKLSELKEYIKRNAWGHHACCTAKIGSDDDKLSVLDKDFKVRGVDGLRVVDASVFPEIPGYFPTVMIHMVGVKAANVIQPNNKFRD